MAISSASFLLSPNTVTVIVAAAAAARSILLPAFFFPEFLVQIAMKYALPDRTYFIGGVSVANWKGEKNQLLTHTHTHTRCNFNVAGFGHVVLRCAVDLPSIHVAMHATRIDCSFHIDTANTHTPTCQCDWLHDPSFQTSFAQSRLQGISQFYDSTKNGHKPKRFISIKSVKVIRVCERAQCHHLLGWLRRLLKLGPPRSHQHPTIANFANWSMQSFRVLWHTDQQQVSQPVRQTAATSVDRFGHYATQQRPLTAN